MNETIKKTEFSILSTFLMRSLFIGWTVYSVSHIALQDGWISMILSFILSFLPLLLYYLLFTFDSKLNIIGILNKYLGYLGKGISIFLCLFVILYASLMLWNLSNFINSQFLYLTPIFLISLVFMSSILYLAMKGLKTIGRTGVILFFIEIVLFILPVIALIGKIEIDELFPILEFGWMPIFKGSLFSISYNVTPLFLLLIIPKDNIENNKKLISSFLKVYIYTFLTIILIIFFCTSILGIKLMNLYQYPEFHILKTINIANFFQRTETILSMQWLFDHIMTLSFAIYFIKTAVLQTFPKLKNENIIILITSTIIFLIAQVILPNNTYSETISIGILPILLFIFYFGIPLLIYIIAKLRK